MQTKLRDDEYPLMTDAPTQSSPGFFSSVGAAYTKSNTSTKCWLWTLTLAVIGLTVGLIAVTLPSKNDDDNGSHISTSSLTSRIAFGSCSSYNMEKQNIWVDGIIPSNPDAWIWAGDFVYLDDPLVNCNVPQNTSEWLSQCACESTWLDKCCYSCTAGDLDHALSRWMLALRNNEYNQFLDYMCPAAKEAGLFPPPGTDPSICTRPIIGTYDDHDYGWNDGNQRLPSRQIYKEMYLDAVGEPQDSPRRGDNRGAWWKYTFNGGQKDASVEVFLLDERYEREPLPCYTQRDYCERTVLPDPSNKDYAWCQDFLLAGYDGKGTCCDRDEKVFFGWCTDPSNVNNQYYQEACNVSSPNFGYRALVLNDDGELVEPDASYPYDFQQDSPFCEMLGRKQRAWLRTALTNSKAPLKLIVSGSVVLAEPYNMTCGTDYYTGEDVECACAKDDMGCYKVAQRELLHLAAHAPGCTVILTGDYHWSDIKVLKPGDQIYAQYFDSYNNPYPLYHVMASGLTTTTGQNWTCDGFRLDPAGLRDHPECDFIRGPSFGMIELEYGKHDKLKIVKLQIRDGNTGEIKLESEIETSQCNPY